MKKIFVVAWILVFLVFPLSSFGGSSERSKVVNDPLFAIYEDLEAELPIFGNVHVDRVILDIVWTGEQNKVVTPSDNHNHHAKVESATGSVTLIGISSSVYGNIPIPVIISVAITSGSMNEHGTGEHSDTKTVDIFFRAKSAIIQTVLPPLLPGPVELGPCMIKIKDGQIQFLKSKALPAPGKNNIHASTFGKIKSKS